MTRTTDPELAAMTTIVRVLADLDDDTRQRVLRWATTRYTPASPTVPTPETPAATRPLLAGHGDAGGSDQP